jgi:hypothetical protein
MNGNAVHRPARSTSWSGPLGDRWSPSLRARIDALGIDGDDGHLEACPRAGAAGPGGAGSRACAGRSPRSAHGPPEGKLGRVKAFLDRPIEGDWPYLWLDATAARPRAGGAGPGGEGPPGEPRRLGRGDRRRRRQQRRTAPSAACRRRPLRGSDRSAAADRWCWAWTSGRPRRRRFGRPSCASSPGAGCAASSLGSVAPKLRRPRGHQDRGPSARCGARPLRGRIDRLRPTLPRLAALMDDRTAALSDEADAPASMALPPAHRAIDGGAIDPSAKRPAPEGAGGLRSVNPLARLNGLPSGPPSGTRGARSSGGPTSPRSGFAGRRAGCRHLPQRGRHHPPGRGAAARAERRGGGPARPLHDA